MTVAEILGTGFEQTGRKGDKLLFKKGNLRLELSPRGEIRLFMNSCSCPFFGVPDYTKEEIKHLLKGLRLLPIEDIT